MTIPLVDLAWQHREIASDVERGVAEVVSGQAFILGPPVAEFEERYARFCEVKHCIGVASGTDALELALRSAGIGPGDEVILPANTFVASALAVARTGATPVFVDQDPTSHLLDVGQVAERIGTRTRAILPVHLYGQLAPMEALEPLVRDGRIALIEDAAQAHGARRRGRPAGAVGAAAATSFYPAKNLGAYGDAGAVLTNDDAIASKLRRLRNYGGEAKYDHAELGFNSRLDTLQAVVLMAKLRHLASWNEERRRAAARYDALLSEIPGVTLPVTLEGNEHVWHLYVVRVADRDRVLGELREAGIGAAIHYPLPIHLQGAFRHLGHGPGDFPESERAAREVLSLPLSPGITAAQQERVAETLRKVVS